jgi:hypothetical protein
MTLDQNGQGLVADLHGWRQTKREWRALQRKLVGDKEKRGREGDARCRFRLRWTPFVRQPEPLLKV